MRDAMVGSAVAILRSLKATNRVLESRSALMNKIRIATLAVLSGLVFAVTGPAASPGGVADLRLYGPVSAEFSSSRVVFHCADETKADWLMGKLLADFFWDAGDAHHEKPLSPDNQTLVFHSWEPYGVLSLLATDGTSLCWVQKTQRRSGA